jgi:hypothetical protein
MERGLVAIRWRRVDVAGLDVCRLCLREDGPELLGHAAFRHGAGEARLTYELRCDAAWRTRSGRVCGNVGSRTVDVVITRGDHGQWTLDGRPVPEVEGLEHLDLGFTPATNLPQLRALGLSDGQAVDLPVAWLDVPPCELVPLPQRYERRGPASYWYDAPAFGYSALLVLAPSGFVRRYPGLWEQVGWTERASGLSAASPARPRPPCAGAAAGRG